MAPTAPFPFLAGADPNVRCPHDGPTTALIPSMVGWPTGSSGGADRLAAVRGIEPDEVPQGPQGWVGGQGGRIPLICPRKRFASAPGAMKSVSDNLT